jgi:formylglycine-generating enzyme required for sulfatase activity
MGHFRVLQPRRRRSGDRRPQLVVAIFLGLLASGAPAAEPAPGELKEVTVKGKLGNVSIRFHYCPVGRLRPDRPLPPAATEPAGGAGNTPAPAPDFDTIPITPFYITETEITLQQFRDLLGDAALNDVLYRIERVTKIHMDFTDVLKEALQRNEAFPVAMTAREDARAFCNGLRDSYSAATASEAGGIVEYMFRIPTHYEWQYACRARTDPNATPTFPHFDVWADPAQLKKVYDAHRAEIDELWKKVQETRRDGRPFQGTQEDVIAILDQLEPPTESLTKGIANVPLKILSWYLEVARPSDRKDFAATQSEHAPKVKSGRPNAWGIYDMHDGVHEWVIVARSTSKTDRDVADDVWRAFSATPPLPPPDPEPVRFLLAGGAYKRFLANEKGAWKEFTIWGGVPSDRTTHDPVPFTPLDEKEAFEMTKEHLPGLRVIMRPALSRQWLLVLRQEVVGGGPPTQATLDRLEARRKAAESVASEGQKPEIRARVAYYRYLALSQMGRLTEASEQLKLANANAGGGAKPEESLEDLLSGRKKPASSPARPAAAAAGSEDANAFLEVLSHLDARPREP